MDANRLIKLLQPERGFRYGIDSFLLARFAQCKPSDRVCDLGAGTGILSILAVQRAGVRQVTAVEAQAESVSFLRQNIEQLKSDAAIDIFAGTWREFLQQNSQERFDVVLSNPPYRKLNTGKMSGESAKDIARHEVLATMSDLVSVARKLLKPDGRFCVLYPPLRLEELIHNLCEQGLKAQRMTMIHPYEDRPATQVLVEAVLSTNRELQIEAPIVIYRNSEQYRPEIEAWVGPKVRQRQPN